jgi:3-isopropylmalate/(R)-2-methylmalate dehydratase large subunit
MGQTITEKILSRHAGADSCHPGDTIWCEPDLMMGHDLSAPHAFSIFKEFGKVSVKHADRLVLVQDHFQPSKDVESALLAATMRQFARQHKVRKYFEVGRGGICHVLLIEEMMCGPGMLVAGADSHICTMGAVGALGWGIGATDMAALLALGQFWLTVPKSRKIILKGKLTGWVCGKDIALAVLRNLGQEGGMDQVLEFAGDTLDDLPMVDRVTIANMAVETGAVSAVLSRTPIVDEFLDGAMKSESTLIESDRDAIFCATDTLDAGSLGPLVAEPFSPANVKPVEDFAEVKVDQVFLGSCTNAWIDDLRRFAAVLGDRQFAPEVRVLVTPATQKTYRQAMEDGILAKIVDAGGAVGIPACGPCLGAQGGLLGAGEICLSTSNRNFRGRMGHLESRVYLASPAVAAATAVTGRITHPGEVAGSSRPH